MHGLCLYTAEPAILGLLGTDFVCLRNPEGRASNSIELLYLRGSLTVKHLIPSVVMSHSVQTAEGCVLYSNFAARTLE